MGYTATLAVSLCDNCHCMTHSLIRGKWRICGKCHHHKENEE